MVASGIDSGRFQLWSRNKTCYSLLELSHCSHRDHAGVGREAPSSSFVHYVVISRAILPQVLRETIGAEMAALSEAKQYTEERS